MPVFFPKKKKINVRLNLYIGINALSSLFEVTLLRILLTVAASPLFHPQHAELMRGEKWARLRGSKCTLPQAMTAVNRQDLEEINDI